MPRAVCARSFSAAFVKLLGPLVIITIVNNKKYTSMTDITKNTAMTITTEPHNELHFWRNLVFTEVVCEERQRIDVCSSSK